MPLFIKTFQHRWLNLSSEHREYFTGLMLYPYLSLADGVFTQHLLEQGGIELNLFMLYLINTFGVNSIFLVKLVAFIVVITATELIRKRGQIHTSRRLIKLAVYTYAGVSIFLFLQSIMVVL